MPKESVVSPVGPYDVSVGWRAEGGVQVGVERGDGGSFLWLLYRPEDVGRVARELVEHGARENRSDELLGESILNSLDVLSGHVSETNAGYNGLWSDLDRSACNRLIKFVRRARDAAYGRDE